VERLIATTTGGGERAAVARAREVASRCGLTYVPRRDSVARLLRAHDAAGAYVVGPTRAELRVGGERLTVHPGTLRIAIHRGALHPLARAVAPPGAAPVREVIDATLGLAKDAVHLAAVLGCRVVGLERSRLLVCLAEDGLARMAAERRPWSAGAGRVEVVEADATGHLAGRPDASVDVVYLDPMFPTPRKAAYGFDLLRRLAWPEPLTAGLLGEALRVARGRVVLKVPRGAQAEEMTPDPAVWTGRVEGTDLDYLIAERAAG